MTATSDTETTFEGWAVLELMGHRRLGGYVTEVELAGKGMLRLDIPGPETGDEPTATQFYSPGALYCLTPVTEDVARGLAARNQPTPVHRWELPAADSADEDEVWTRG
jgi:hypothetical protein